MNWFLIKGTTRRSGRQQNQTPNPNDFNNYGPYDGFGADPQAFGAQYYSGQSMFQPSDPQGFGDMSSQPYGGPTTFDPYSSSGNTFGNQPFNASNSANFLNQQMLLTAGQQLLTNPMAAAAIDQYGQNLVNKGKSWVGSNVRLYTLI